MYDGFGGGAAYTRIILFKMDDGEFVVMYGGQPLTFNIAKPVGSSAGSLT